MYILLLLTVNKMKNILLFIILIILFSGCATTRGIYHLHEGNYYGTYQISGNDCTKVVDQAINEVNRIENIQVGTLTIENHQDDWWLASLLFGVSGAIMTSAVADSNNSIVQTPGIYGLIFGSGFVLSSLITGIYASVGNVCHVRIRTVGDRTYSIHDVAP